MNDHIPSGLGAVDRVDSGAGAQSVHQASAVPSAVVSVSAAWQPIETAPKGRTVMAGYWNSLRKWRTVIACYYLPQTLELDDQYSDDGDGFAPEGWYEESESLETIRFTEEPPTHWMPLPAPPAAATGGKTA